MLVILLICCILSGCSKHETENIIPLVKGFECDFSIADSDLNGQLSVNQEGDLSLVFSGPDIINGVGIRVKEESVIVEVKGISERYSINEAPSNSPALLLYYALISMADKHPKVIDNKIQIIGSSQSCGYKATLNGTGQIVSIDFEENDITLNFTNHVETKQ